MQRTNAEKHRARELESVENDAKKCPKQDTQR